MGLHIGGIYVNAKNEITQQSVADFIKSYWLKLGAKLSHKNPLEFKPLGLKETGLLGFTVCTKENDDQGQAWIGVYDSERYHGDYELARALALGYNTDVWIYQIVENTDAARAVKVNGQGEESVLKEWNEVMTMLEHLPFYPMYFDHIKDWPTEGPNDRNLNAKDMIFLAFESVPYRPDKEYTGPKE